MTIIQCAACKQTIDAGRIEPRPFVRWGIIAILAATLIAGIGIGRAFGQAEPPLPAHYSDASLDAFMLQIYSQGLALKLAQAERCIRQHRFAALTVHDGCLFEVSSFNGPFPQFRLCRDRKGEPVCGGRR